MSHPDEIRLTAKELEWMYKPRKTKGCAERLAEIRAGADRPAGTYHPTSYDGLAAAQRTSYHDF